METLCVRGNVRKKSFQTRQSADHSITLSKIELSLIRTKHCVLHVSWVGRSINYTSKFVLLCDLILKLPLNGHSGILGAIITAPLNCVMKKANNPVSHTVTPNLSKAYIY